MKYDEDFFTEAWFSNWSELQYILADLVLAVPSWRSVLDFGCGPGVMIDLMNQRGLDYTGYDPSPGARALYLKHYGQCPDKFVSKLNKDDFDVVVSFDVLEHMNDDEIDLFISKFANVRDILVNISRVPGIPGHINLKTDNQWIAFFELRGRVLNKTLTATLRNRYKNLKENCSDAWDRNMFVFSL
ncbi:hypothetical protein JCM14713_09500 [Desulfomicrobium salsuginis]